MSDKQLVLDVVRELPESSTLEEITEELEILAAIREGKRDIAAGRFHTIDEMRKQVAEWTSK